MQKITIKSVFLFGLIMLIRPYYASSQKKVVFEFFPEPLNPIEINVVQINNHTELKSLKLDTIQYPVILIRSSVLNQVFETSNQNTLLNSNLRKLFDEQNKLLQEQNKLSEIQITKLTSVNKVQERFLSLNEQAVQNITKSNEVLNEQLKQTNDRIISLERRRDARRFNYMILGGIAGVSIGLIVGILIK